VALASGVGKCRWNGCGRDSTLGFHPGEPICSACVEAAPARQEEAAKVDIPDDYFITADTDLEEWWRRYGNAEDNFQSST